MSEFPNPEESPFEHPNGNTYVWNGWAWEIEGKSNDYATEEYVDDATTQTLKDSKAYTDEKIAKGVEGLASEEYVNNAIDAIPEVEIPEIDLDDYATKEYVNAADNFLQNQINAIAEIPASKDYYLSAVDSSSHATLKLGDSENEQNNWTQVDFFGGKGINVSTDEIMQSITITADDVELPDNLATTDYVDEAIDAIEIPELELPQTLAYTDKNNHFTARQNIELDSGTGLLIKKGDNESFKLFADGTAEQLIEHDNVKPSNIVTRKNLTDAIDAIEIPEVDLDDYAKTEEYNEFKQMQSFDPIDTSQAAIRVQEDNVTTLKIFPSGLIKQTGEHGNSQRLSTLLTVRTSLMPLMLHATIVLTLGLTTLLLLT